MKNSIFIITSLAVLFGAFFLYQNRGNSSNQDMDTSQQFNFIFRYGVGLNELNTFENTFTKDMVGDPPITVSLELTRDEMDAVRQKTEVLNVFEQTVKSDGSMVIPCSSYYIMANLGSETKENSWDDCTGEIGPELKEFTSYVIQIIESKREYKELPEPTSGYQ